MNEININTNIITILFFTSTLLTIGVCLFFIGYLYAKTSFEGVCNSTKHGFKKFLSNTDNHQNNDIIIDDSKFVSSISTDNLEKKYVSLGETKETKENIHNSVNKLKNLKK